MTLFRVQTSPNCSLLYMNFGYRWKKDLVRSVERETPPQRSQVPCCWRLSLFFSWIVCSICLILPLTSSKYVGTSLEALRMTLTSLLYYQCYVTKFLVEALNFFLLTGEGSYKSGIFSSSDHTPLASLWLRTRCRSGPPVVRIRTLVTRSWSLWL